MKIYCKTVIAVDIHNPANFCQRFSVFQYEVASYPFSHVSKYFKSAPQVHLLFSFFPYLAHSPPLPLSHLFYSYLHPRTLWPLVKFRECVSDKESERKWQRELEENSETTASFFCWFLTLHLTPPLALSRPLFSSSYLLGGEEVRVRKSNRQRRTHTQFWDWLDRKSYKSSLPYRGQHTDKGVSTPHPTDPSPKTSETHVGRCGNLRVCNWQIDGSIPSHYFNMSHAILK